MSKHSLGQGCSAGGLQEAGEKPQPGSLPVAGLCSAAATRQVRKTDPATDPEAPLSKKKKERYREEVGIQSKEQARNKSGPEEMGTRSEPADGITSAGRPKPEDPAQLLWTPPPTLLHLETRTRNARRAWSRQAHAGAPGALQSALSSSAQESYTGGCFRTVQGPLCRAHGFNLVQIQLLCLPSCPAPPSTSCEGDHPCSMKQRSDPQGSQ